MKRLFTAAIVVLAMATAVMATESTEEYATRVTKTRTLEKLTCKTTVRSERPAWQRIASLGLFELIGTDIKEEASYDFDYPGGVEGLKELLIERNPDLAALTSPMLMLINNSVWTPAYSAVTGCQSKQNKEGDILLWSFDVLKSPAASISFVKYK